MFYIRPNVRIRIGCGSNAAKSRYKTGPHKQAQKWGAQHSCRGRKKIRMSRHATNPKERITIVKGFTVEGRTPEKTGHPRTRRPVSQPHASRTKIRQPSPRRTPTQCQLRKGFYYVDAGVYVFKFREQPITPHVAQIAIQRRVWVRCGGET